VGISFAMLLTMRRTSSIMSAFAISASGRLSRSWRRIRRKWRELKKPKIRPPPRADLSVEQVIERKPDWVNREITAIDAKALAGVVRRTGANTIAEIGVATGFSSAILYAACRSDGGQPAVYGFDLSESLYYDARRKTGDAFYEILGDAPGNSPTVGIYSAGVSDLPAIDFLFIDACHQHPWPALDLLSLSRFLKQGAVVALHDIELIFKKRSWARLQDGPRDLYRSWRSQKWIADETRNLGFLLYDRRAMLESLPSCLSLDWNTSLSEEISRQYLGVCALIPGSSAIADVIAEQSLRTSRNPNRQN
jgi:predicted O-methyltransferase YrrM